MEQDNHSQAPSRVYLSTHPRTASNFLVKVLNLGEQNVPSRFQAGYFFPSHCWKGIQKMRLLA
jgi:hypothetical protein